MEAENRERLEKQAGTMQGLGLRGRTIRGTEMDSIIAFRSLDPLKTFELLFPSQAALVQASPLQDEGVAWLQHMSSFSSAW